MPKTACCQHDIRIQENSMEYQGFATREALAIHFWKCKHCGDWYEKQWYRYYPFDCPQHIWEFAGWKYTDSGNNYTLDREWICAMCAKRYVEPVKKRSFGKKEITLDHPLIQSRPSRETKLWHENETD